MSKFMKMTASLAIALGVTHSAHAADMSVAQHHTGYDWTGGYIGLHAGYGTAEVSAGPTVFSLVEPDGFVGGAHIGYNFMSNSSWVFGIEADISGANLDDSTPCPNPVFTCNAEVDWIATIRGRAGLTWSRYLAYVTAGVAFSELDLSAVPAAGGFNESQNYTGFVIGGGIEGRLSDRWTGRVEGLYHDFGSEPFVNIGGPVDLEIFVIRAGVSMDLN